MISMIIPNFNGSKFLKECMASIYKETKDTKLPFEVIIVDNGSTDDSREHIKNYKEVVAVFLDKNYGFSRAVNEGIKRAKGEYILLLNNDTAICAGFLEALYEAVKEPKVFSVCSKMLRYHERDTIDDAGDGYTLLGWAYKRGDGQPEKAYDMPREVFSSCAGAAIYKKEVFEEIGYFDENFFAYMEDVDLSYRARVYGYKNRYEPKARVYHIGSGTSGSKYNAFKVRLAARNNLFVPYKNMPTLQLLINLPFLVLGYLIKYLFFIKKGFGKEYRQGFVEGLKEKNKIQKIPFQRKNLANYFKIQLDLIVETLEYIKSKLI